MLVCAYVCVCEKNSMHRKFFYLFCFLIGVVVSTITPFDQQLIEKLLDTNRLDHTQNKFVFIFVYVHVQTVSVIDIYFSS